MVLGFPELQSEKEVVMNNHCIRMIFSTNSISFFKFDLGYICLAIFGMTPDSAKFMVGLALLVAMTCPHG